jgi:hypothetical protein
MDDAVSANLCARADRDIRKNHRVVADARILRNGDKRPDRHIAADLRIGGYRGEWMKSWRRTPCWCEQSDGSREGQIRIRRSEHRAGGGARIVAEHDGRGVRLHERRFVLGVGEKREITRLCVLNARHPSDFDVAIAFEATPKAVGQITELHDG